MHGLYLITPADADDPDQLARDLDLALGGGASWIQFRFKGTDNGLRQALGAAVADTCTLHRVPLIVNDDPILAKDLGATGVHLGQQDGAIATSRGVLGNHVMVGRTCHGSLSLMRQAVAEGADYCAFGRMFDSTTKPDAPGVTLEALADLVRNTPIPTVAIGGITLQNAPSVLATGVNALAVSGAVFKAQDIFQTAVNFATLIKEAS